MSSNFTINRVCRYCGNEFAARTTVTKYCSHKCNNLHYKASIRQTKIDFSNQQTQSVMAVQKTLKLEKQFLTAGEVAAFIGSSTRSIYNMINSGRLKAYNLGTRMIRIMREDVLSLLDNSSYEPPVYQEKMERNTILVKKNCYSIKEICVIYNVTPQLIYHLAKRENIPKFMEGRNVYLLKKAVQEAFNLRRDINVNSTILIKNYYTVNEVVDKYEVSPGRIYCLLQRKKIRKVRHGRHIYLSLVDTDTYFKTV